jgi:hypothetical protein
MSGGRRRSVSELAIAGFVVLAATLVVTWPLGLHVTDRLTGSWDAFFGAWRLAWIADAVKSPDLHLFNAPIFYPEPRALAYSDAILLPGLLFAPLRYLGVAAPLTYNLALFAAFVSSGVALFVLVRSMGVRTDAALVGAIIFALSPYRLDHLDHFEMQMAVWMPIALWLWHRAADRGSIADGAGAVAAVALQWLSCIYYGILFAPVFAVAIANEWITIPRGRKLRVVAAMAAAAAAGLLAIWWYSQPYLANREQTGDRLAEDVVRYSATLSSYFTVHPHNVVYGKIPLLDGLYETRIFPGLIALVLTGLGVIAGPWNRRRWTYVLMGIVAFDLSLGTNGLLFPLLREYAVPYRGLRAPARAGVIVVLVISVLASFGAGGLFDRVRGKGARLGLAAAVILLLLVEYRTPPDLWELPTTPDVPHLGLARGSVVLEMPIATSERFDRSVDAFYMLNRVGAWPSLVNGYSGYYPQAYITMTERTRLFPDTRAIREIARIGVTVLVIHERWYGTARYKEILAALDARSDVEPVGKYVEDGSGVAVYHVKPLVP